MLAVKQIKLRWPLMKAGGDGSRQGIRHLGPTILKAGNSTDLREHQASRGMFVSSGDRLSTVPTAVTTIKTRCQRGSQGDHGQARSFLMFIPLMGSHFDYK